jgi:Mg-chelatase subunit ChlD
MEVVIRLPSPIHISMMEIEFVEVRYMLNRKQLYAGLLLSLGVLSICSGLNRSSAETDAQAVKARPRIDLAFCIDTTGSMQNEIDSVKSKTKEIVAQLSGTKPIPIIRVGVIAFRDRGDDYVTKVFPFRDDIDAVVKDISTLEANGGGDAPEAVNQALHSAVNDLKWNDDKKTVKQLFLIGDAGPNEYPNDFKWEDECKNAISRGIQINTIACMGLTGGDLEVFQKIAKLTDGAAENLTYKQEIVNSQGHTETVISSGGESFAVTGAADWREGASSLSAKGLVTAPTPSRHAGYAAGFAAPSAFRSSTGASMDMSTAADESVSRKESNLADLVLKKTKSALDKKMAE